MLRLYKNYGILGKQKLSYSEKLTVMQRQWDGMIGEAMGIAEDNADHRNTLTITEQVPMVFKYFALNIFLLTIL